MKRLSVISVFILLAALTTPALGITWGEPDTEHPFVGAMIVNWPNYGPWQWCSGTLIHEKVFITASHCTFDLDEYGIDTVWVNFNEYALNPDTMLLVDQIITHPEFQWGGKDFHDVALLVLTDPVLDIEPAALPNAGFMNDLNKEGLLKVGVERAMLTAVGYGGSLEFPPPEIYYDDIRQVAYTEFSALLPTWIHTNQNQKLGNGGTCFGDSGGPIFWTNEDGSDVLVGLVSWGDAMCMANGFNYRVDTPQTLLFIYEVIMGLTP
jgi:secreted trypsin-like serine protease